MRGHLPLVAMRRAGAVPDSTTLSIDAVQLGVVADWPKHNWPGSGVHAEVYVEPQDSIARLDLRFLVALPLVWVEGTNAARLQALYAACVQAKAARVVSIRFADSAPTKVVEYVDSTGALTWQG